MYTDAQIDFIKQVCRSHNYYFGYANVKPDSATNFFEYESHSPQDLKDFEGYLHTHQEEQKPNP